MKRKCILPTFGHFMYQGWAVLYRNVYTPHKNMIFQKKFGR